MDERAEEARELEQDDREAREYEPAWDEDEGLSWAERVTEETWRWSR